MYPQCQAQSVVQCTVSGTVHSQLHSIVAPGTISFGDMQLGEHGLGQVYCWGAESGGMEHGFDMLGVGAADMQDWTYRSLFLHCSCTSLLRFPAPRQPQ